MKEEFEIISHENVNYKVFLINMIYRSPHIHKDFEICLLLEGALTLHLSSENIQLQTNDFFIINPFQSHELDAKKAALILSLQVPAAFFSAYFPQMDNIEFLRFHLTSKSHASVYFDLHRTMLNIARNYFFPDKFSILKCVADVNMLFALLLDALPCQLISEKEKNVSKAKAGRIRSITTYIDDHYTEKLLLSDIAQQESLSLHYLSHFFKETIGVSFQVYLLKIRCEKARQLLILTDYSLLDICMMCGFSDPKYFNSGFRSQFGCSPKEYRKCFQGEALLDQQKSMLTTQEFLSPEASRITLDRYISANDSGI